MTAIGLILVAIGVIALLARLGVISGAMWGYIWPVVLIIIGLWFFVRWRWWRRRWWCDWDVGGSKRDRSKKEE
jgi:hypothetical protein